MRRAPLIGLASLLLVLPAPASTQVAPPPLCRALLTVADDFIVDVYHNGVKVPDDRRELLEELHGATVERISVDVRPGDWLVFNVVNNRLRWGGASYFAVSARGDHGIAFATDPASDRWSACDDPALVAAFIADRDFLSARRARPIATPWTDGDSKMAHHADGWSGRPLWGESRNTWIKYVAR
jgi:hypothetical protein